MDRSVRESSGGYAARDWLASPSAPSPASLAAQGDARHACFRVVKHTWGRPAVLLTRGLIGLDRDPKQIWPGALPPRLWMKPPPSKHAVTMPPRYEACVSHEWKTKLYTHLNGPMPHSNVVPWNLIQSFGGLDGTLSLIVFPFIFLLRWLKLLP